MSNFPENPTNRSILNDHKVDSLTTKDNNMKMRRVTNAAPAVENNDYVILSQLNGTNSNLNQQLQKMGGKFSQDLSNLAKTVSLIVDYGTHAARLAINTKGMPDGAIFFETDRNNVEYQLQSNVWYYVGGTMLGTLSPDQRPTGLGTTDTGFLFQTTDTNQLYMWSGSGWVLETPTIPPIPITNTILYANSSTNLVLSNTPLSVPGTFVNISIAGYYLVMGVFFFHYLPADFGSYMVGNMNPTQGASAIFAATPTSSSPMDFLVSQNWALNITSVPTTINLTAYKSGGSGVSACNSPHTSITAVLID